MRVAFIETIEQIAKKNKKLFLLTGDLGFGLFENFKEKFPEQFLNVGVAEQNLMGVAAGLALAGKKVFVYSISTFASLRAYEQIRNDIAYQKLPVYIIGGGSAFSYSAEGCTHMPLEDLGVMRVMPNMTVLSPGDPVEVSSLIKQIYRQNNPAYMRIAKRGDPVVHNKNDKIVLGKMSEIKTGKDITLIATGVMLPKIVNVANFLIKKGVICRVLSGHTIKPIDKKAIIKAAKETGGIITCEEHNIIGGLGTAVAEVLSQNRLAVPFYPIGIPDEFPKVVGSQNYLASFYGLDEKNITNRVYKILKSIL